MLRAIALCFLGLGVCAPNTVPAKSALTIIVPTLRPTPAPPVTPPPVEDALDTVRRALRADEPSLLTSLLPDEVVLAREPGAVSGELIGRDTASEWLKAYWNSQHEVVGSKYIEHFVLLGIKSQGWQVVAPAQTGNPLFHLHRYNAPCRSDTLDGRWRIDAILYE